MKLKIWLKNNNVSSKLFAKMVGVVPQTVSNWTTGKVLPHLTISKKIEEVTKGQVTIQDFSEPEEEGVTLRSKRKCVLARMRYKNPIYLYMKDNRLHGYEFAALVKISPAYVSRFINGNRTPNMDMIEIIEYNTGGKISQQSLIDFYYVEEDDDEYYEE